jgi:hypothetical protein
MKIRKATSLTALLSFVLLATTSVILYIVPHGRVAYWTDWHLWGLSKTQWESFHLNLGLLLLLTILFHIYLNWKVIVSYFKDKTKQAQVFTREFNIAVVLTMVFLFGTYLEIPPFIWVVEISESIKDSAAKKYGEPPYGHAELSSLKTLTSRMGFDLAKNVDGLRAAGVQFDNENQTIQEIAKHNNMSPQQVYQAMEPLHTAGENKKLPLAPPPGLGRRSLADMCQEYNLHIPTILRRLADKNIQAAAGLTIKQIAEHNKLSPTEVYDVIRGTGDPAASQESG